MVGQTLAKREITVNDHIFVLLVVLFRLNVKNFTFKGRVRMSDKHILCLELLNLAVLRHGDKAGRWDLELHFFDFCIDLLGNFLVGLARLA